jgi:hypothetical protein
MKKTSKYLLTGALLAAIEGLISTPFALTKASSEFQPARYFLFLPFTLGPGLLANLEKNTWTTWTTAFAAYFLLLFIAQTTINIYFTRFSRLNNNTPLQACDKDVYKKTTA